MRKLAILTVALAALAVPSLSHAQVTLGLRLAIAPAGGDAVSGGSMSDFVKSQIPVQLDALYRVNKNVGLGGYFSYGFGQAASGLCGGVDCDSASVTRLGLQATYTFDSTGQFVPWAGVGFGYEWTEYKYGGLSETLKGWEFLNLQLGGDFALTPQFAVGPFVGLSFAQYSNVDLAGGGSATIPDTTTHEWFQFGFRGKFDL